MHNELATIPACDTPQCPKCGTGLDFRRNANPDIDACGFESYQLECRECGAALVGIIDPADNMLLVTECDPPRHAAPWRIAV